jgi:carbonic anhydrase
MYLNLFAALAVLLGLPLAFCNTPTSGNDPTGNLPTGHVVNGSTCEHSTENWTYAESPCWAKHYPHCEHGHQSPIDLTDAGVVGVKDESFMSHCYWKPVREVEVTNSGHALHVLTNQMGYFGMVNLKGQQVFYQAVELVLHMPSEHRINGKQFSAELQVVHKFQHAVTDLIHDDMAIASFMLEEGPEESAFLKQFSLPGAPVAEGAPPMIMEHPLDLMRAFGPALDGHFFRYDGSQTKPPCTQKVKWFVFDTPTSMSHAQLLAFQTLFPSPGNSRPLQPLHGHKVVKNSFEGGELIHFDFYLGRETARNYRHRERAIIIVPIVGTVILAVGLMSVVFVQNPRRRSEGSGGP